MATYNSALNRKMPNLISLYCHNQGTCNTKFPRRMLFPSLLYFILNETQSKLYFNGLSWFSNSGLLDTDLKSNLSRKCYIVNLIQSIQFCFEGILMKTCQKLIVGFYYGSMAFFALDFDEFERSGLKSCWSGYVCICYKLIFRAV